MEHGHLLHAQHERDHRPREAQPHDHARRGVLGVSTDPCGTPAMTLLATWCAYDMLTVLSAAACCRSQMA